MRLHEFVWAMGLTWYGLKERIGKFFWKVRRELMMSATIMHHAFTRPHATLHIIRDDVAKYGFRTWSVEDHK